MWLKFKWMPSGPTAIAFTALLVALSGTAVALPGSNAVDSGDIKNQTVRGKDLRRNAVTSAKVKNGSLLAADFRSGQLPAGAGARPARRATPVRRATPAPPLRSPR